MIKYLYEIKIATNGYYIHQVTITQFRRHISAYANLFFLTGKSFSLSQNNGKVAAEAIPASLASFSKTLKVFADVKGLLTMEFNPKK